MLPSNRNMERETVLQHTSAWRRLTNCSAPESIVPNRNIPLIMSTEMSSCDFHSAKTSRTPLIPYRLLPERSTEVVVSTLSCIIYSRQVRTVSSQDHCHGTIQRLCHITSVVPISRINFLPWARTQGDGRRRHIVMHPRMSVHPFLSYPFCPNRLELER